MTILRVTVFLAGRTQDLITVTVAANVSVKPLYGSHGALQVHPQNFMRQVFLSSPFYSLGLRQVNCLNHPKPHGK